MAELPIAIGVASRPHPAETVNGDAHAVHWSGTRGAGTEEAGTGRGAVCRLTVIDGLGHGPEAAAAAAAAIRVLDAQPDLDPAEALRRCHVALQGTRGAAISIARVDPAAGELVYAGIGNVETHLWQAGRHERLIAYRGIVGAVMRTVRPFTLRLAESWTLLMHSDGIMTRADILALGLAEPWDPESLAAAVLERYSRQHDDVLALVALPRR